MWEMVEVGSKRVLSFGGKILSSSKALVAAQL